MATPIVAPKGPRTGSIASLPPGITTAERTDCVEYIGPAEDLIAAGLVRRNQFPPQGRVRISYLQGIKVDRRCRVDETFLRVELRFNGTVSVSHGLPPDQVRANRAQVRERNRAERERYRAEWRAEEEKQLAEKRREKAELAKRSLKSVFENEDKYRRGLVERFKDLLNIVFADADRPKDWHGYRLDRESVESILLAGDAITEAIMQANVIFDAELHERIVADYRATIRAADPGFEKQFDAITKPNPSILEGEQA